MIVKDPMLTDPEVAEMIGISLQTLRQKRCEGNPVPDYVKISTRCVRTRTSAVERFLDEYTVKVCSAPRN